MPVDIAAGPDGDLWFTESAGNKIGRITTAGRITEFRDASLSPLDVTRGPASNGDIWVVDGGGTAVGVSTPNGVMTSFPLPHSQGGYGWSSTAASDITAGPDGNLWFVGSNRTCIIGKCHDRFFIATMATNGSITSQFNISSPGDHVAVGPDNNLWFTENDANQIGRITTSGVVTEFPVPTAGAGPDCITSGADGNIWFTEANANQIGKITPLGAITEFPIPTTASAPAGITSGSDGDVWFTENSGNKLGRITGSGIITEFSLVRSSSGPDGIVTGPDGDLWFTEIGAQGNRIGRFVP